MKKLLISLLLVIFSFSIVHAGLIYTDTKTPVSAASGERGVRLGTSQATTFLWAFTIGDASIDTAARKSNVGSISHVDSKDFCILGIPGLCLYGVKTTEVYGR
ncbi:MAG: TRL-like family protein [Candidatus Margulisbacteria bacterium]|nr:TRL-like family protein [Candidatus Margulisiibacteriota bacterium]